VGHPSALLALQLARTRIDMVLDFAEASDAVCGLAELIRDPDRFFTWDR